MYIYIPHRSRAHRARSRTGFPFIEKTSENGETYRSETGSDKSRDERRCALPRWANTLAIQASKSGRAGHNTTLETTSTAAATVCLAIIPSAPLLPPSFPVSSCVSVLRLCSGRTFRCPEGLILRGDWTRASHWPCICCCNALEWKQSHRLWPSAFRAHESLVQPEQAVCTHRDHVITAEPIQGSVVGSPP